MTPTKRYIIYLSLTIVATIIGTAYAYRVWRYDYLTFPVVYSHDGIDFIKTIKSFTETGSFYNSNPRLGTPGTANKFAQVYAPDVALLGLIKILIAGVGSNAFLVTNLFVLISFIAVSVCAYAVYSRLGISNFGSSILALIYTFLPFHFVRVAAGHLFLTYYFMVPILGFLCLKLMTRSLRVLTKKTILGLMLMCLVVGSVGTGYYALFSILLLLFSGVVGSIWQKKFTPLLFACVLALGIGLSLWLNVWPTLRHGSEMGSENINQRSPFQTEEYGLRISRLITPLQTTKMLPRFSTLLNQFYARDTHENFQFLGLVGVIGFLYALWQLIVGKSYDLDRAAGVLTGFCLFWGVSGGAAFLYSFFINSQIRAYNRLSVFIAFFSLYMFARVYQKLKLKYNQRGLWVIFAVIVTISLWDQLATAKPHENFFMIKQRFLEDQNFTQIIDRELPENTKVFQLPYMTYPEASAQCGLDSYDHLYPYLHSSKLKWSFGAVKGTPEDFWYREVGLLPAEKIYQKLKSEGFGAILIDRSGCYDGVGLEAKIKAMTKLDNFYSQDGRRILIRI